MTRSLAHAMVSISVAMFIAVPALAASSVKVTQSEWAGGATLPSYVNMYIYVPDALATKPPILVASHHCGGSAKSTYDETKSSFVSLSDKNGFIIIFPEATGQNCWDVGSSRSLKHDGGGDTHAIAQMVRYTLSKYKADPGRIYAFGGSSGAMMTQALLGIYPDIFMGGVAVSGVPCGCWAQGYNDVTGSGSTAQWSGPCANGEVSKTAQEWGDLVRKMFPTYSGHRPRVQLWHGDPDPTIDEKNLPEAIKEWTNLLGLPSSPTTTENPNSNTTHQIWKTSCGTQLETFSIKGAGHGVQWDTPTTSGFLGLADKAATQDPETAVCPDAVPSGTGAGGAGGQTGSGGKSETSDSGAGGSLRDGGLGGAAGSAGGGGMTGGGSGGSAGGSGQAGRSGSGGRSGTGGMESSGGSSTSGKAGASGSGGVVGSGGSSISGSGGAGVGGAQSVGGASGVGGGPGTGATTSESTAGGCSCSVGMTPARSRQWKFGLLLLGVTLIHRRRRRTLGS